MRWRLLSVDRGMQVWRVLRLESPLYRMSFLNCGHSSPVGVAGMSALAMPSIRFCELDVPPRQRAALSQGADFGFARIFWWGVQRRSVRYGSSAWTGDDRRILTRNRRKGLDLDGANAVCRGRGLVSDLYGQQDKQRAQREKTTVSVVP